MCMSSMEERLFDAAFRGDTTALTKLLDEDPNLLDRSYLKCEDKNVLHVVAMLGNEEFFQAVLRVNSSFCYDMCMARDRDGKNSIHLATIHGKLSILNLVKDHDWLVQAAMEKTDRGGTILHLSVKHNQLEALKLLLNIFTDSEFPKTRNDDGMTILHLAPCTTTKTRRREVITYLISNVVEIVNLKNADDKTALDLSFGQAKIGMGSLFHKKKQIIEHDHEMAHSLLRAKALPGRDVTNPNGSWFEKRRDAIMVVASLIATMAFQAMISPPGGTWQDDNSHRVGESVMAQTHPKYYKHLIQANTVAFVSSLSIIIVLIRGMSIRPSHFYALLSLVMWLSVAATAVVYSISLVAIVPESVRGSNLGASSEIAIILTMVGSLMVIAIVVEKCYEFKNSRKPSILSYF